MIEKVFVGIPSYDGRVNSGLLNAHAFASRLERSALEVMVVESGSWLTRNFNSLYASALNMRKERGLTHFCLLHDDVCIDDPWWLDKMLDLMAKNEADVLSAIIPIKNGTGITSTAFDELVGDVGHKHIRRLTMKEAFEKFPSTFTDEKLLLNTGLMLIDIRKFWAENIWFEFEDRILRVSTDNGPRFTAVGCPEDWNFSRKAKAAGAKLFATREIKATHLGVGKWRNHGPWGSMEVDQ